MKDFISHAVLRRVAIYYLIRSILVLYSNNGKVLKLDIVESPLHGGSSSDYYLYDGRYTISPNSLEESSIGSVLGNLNLTFISNQSLPLISPITNERISLYKCLYSRADHCVTYNDSRFLRTEVLPLCTQEFPLIVTSSAII